jgi:uncharacterized membrane protein YbhN (UPF0104 family)
MTRGKTKHQLNKKEVVVRFAASGIEIAVYIVAPIFIGYLVGRHFGNIGSFFGLALGSILGLGLAVKRAIKMTL